MAGLGTLLLILQASCGSDGSTSSPLTGGTAAGSYNLTVTMAWESVQSTATATLVVQ